MLEQGILFSVSQQALSSSKMPLMRRLSAWRLALFSMAVIPGISFAGGLYAYTLIGLTFKHRESYANAGIIVEKDYHRFQVLVSGKFERFVHIPGCLYTVAFVAIGATMVGSITFSKKERR